MKPIQYEYRYLQKDRSYKIIRSPNFDDTNPNTSYAVYDVEDHLSCSWYCPYIPDFVNVAKQPDKPSSLEDFL